MKLIVLKLSAVACGLILGGITHPTEASDLSGHHSSGNRAAGEQRASLAPVFTKGGELSGTNTVTGNRAEAALQTPNYGPPYPFTREQLWKKMLEIAALPNGYVTRSDVERNFGVTLKAPLKRAPEGNTSHIHVVQAGVSWYFDMGVEEISATESDFHFQWGRPPGTPLDRFTGLPPLPAGMCITREDVTSGLDAAGWQLIGRTPEKSEVGKGVWAAMPNFRHYHKNERGMLYVEYQEGCLASITVSATDHPRY